jgi:hypothetical protein
MRLRDIVKLQKSLTTAGTWKVVTRQAKMPSSAFRLSRRASYELPRHWHWRVDELSADGYDLRLLTAFRPEVEEYRALLGMVVGENLRIVARLEFHGDHRGWHCHGYCGDQEDVPLSDPGPRVFQRAPEAESAHRRLDFGLTSETDASHRAFRFFRVEPEKDWGLSP